MEMKDIIKQHTDAVETMLDDMDAKVKTVDIRVSDIEQKLARRPGDALRTVGAGGWGRDFISQKGAELGLLAQQRGRVAGEIKTTLTSDDAGVIGIPTRDQLLGLPKRRLTVRSLLTVVPVNSGSIEVPKLTGRTNNAAAVAEGTLKPESALTLALENVPIRTIAHWIPASVQVLEDVEQLAALIDEELRYGVALVEEDQLLFGSGTGVNIEGMVTQATAYADPLGLTEPTMIDKIGTAILQASLTDVPVDGVIINPSDWWRMRLLKNADGEYILGDPASNPTPALFGLPVVATPAMPVDSFLVGGFKSQTLYNRHDVRVEVSTEHADFFTRNLVAIRAEERIGLATKRPEALIYGDFGNVA